MFLRSPTRHRGAYSCVDGHRCWADPIWRLRRLADPLAADPCRDPAELAGYREQFSFATVVRYRARLETLAAGALQAMPPRDQGLNMCRACAFATVAMKAVSQRATSERATERVAILMSPSEKAAFAGKARTLGLSLGQFFREAGAAYAPLPAEAQADDEALLEAALRQLELSTARTEQALDQALDQVRAALQA